MATTTLLANTFFSFELNELLIKKPGFINFTKDLILEKTPLLFPSHHMVIEVLEDIEPDEPVIDALDDFRANGYQIALDDFVYQKKFHPMISRSDIIKIDVGISFKLLKFTNSAYFSRPGVTPGK